MHPILSIDLAKFTDLVCFKWFSTFNTGIVGWSIKKISNSNTKHMGQGIFPNCSAYHIPFIYALLH